MNISKKGRPQDESVKLAMYEIFDYIENNEDCQFTLSELKEVLTTDFIPDSKTIYSKLMEHYGKKIIITPKQGQSTIICFIESQFTSLSKSWCEKKKIESAGRTSTNRRSGSTTQSIYQSCYNEVRFGSKRISDILSSLGFSSTYHEAVLYETAIVKHPQPNILLPETGAFIQYSADNADINVYTKIKKLPAAKDIAAIAHMPLKIYENYAGHETCVVTFDQPLFIKAREIVAASKPGSELSKVIIRLGGFHLLLSFLGSIGYIMAGSGLKELLVAVRDHILLHLALSTIVAEYTQIDDSTEEYLRSFINQIIKRNCSYEDVECSSIKDFIRSERLGNWQGHLNADMLKLQKNIDQQAFKKFNNGFFTIRRNNKFNCGNWSDMVIEQSLMKSMKTEGGVSRGRSTQESVLIKWIYRMYALNSVCEELETFCNISLDTVDQHVDTRD
ncbi:Uncharacterized protein FWK35_00023698 [Aphis craccivora]|uniref:Uncharacterized protein n=1 Tax=Aphis craccivora TaxID=307492 RepID=A0A6G0XCG8_APHCR|nr:Uncharacterized protein FWK35_00023698 [Aphis craccivora]